MKSVKLLNYLMIVALILGSVHTMAQESFYRLESGHKLKTNDAKAQKRVGTCWSNAGAAFIEAEWLRTGKDPVDISMLDFVHNAYLKKASVFFETDDKLRVDPAGIAFDVIALSREYGMVPEDAFMYPADEMTGSREKEGEMDAILRGTVNMVKQRGDEFSERWQNVYSTSLLRYLGESKIEFNYEGTTYTPVTFAEYSGLNFDDYIMLTSDSEATVNQPVEIEFKENWAGHTFYNVTMEQLVSSVSESIRGGYPVLWYGIVSDEHIFDAENMALVPAGELPGAEEEPDPAEEIEYKPIPEKEITGEMRKKAIDKGIFDEQDYLLIYGVKKDQDGDTYFESKYVCKSGNQVLNLSVPFTKLNTIYLMMNKNGLPGTVKSNLGL